MITRTIVSSTILIIVVMNALIKSSIFYLHYLIPTILKQQKDRTEYCFHDYVHNNNNIFHFNVSDIDNNVYLVITPLTEKEIDTCVFT
jgi:hypothetical protein